MGLGSPNLAELLAHAGYDWLVIETEHNALDTAQIEHMLMAINGTEAIPIVRIPSANPVFIQRALDIGGMGILVPMVKTADEAQAIVDATRYPPQGKRGWGPLRASQYTVDNEDYFNRANDNILVFLLIETKEAVENLEEIGAVPGVDVLYIGMWDLCLSMGLNPLHMPHPETDAVIERALEVGRSPRRAMLPSGSERAHRRDCSGDKLKARFHCFGLRSGLLPTSTGSPLPAGLEAFKRS